MENSIDNTIGAIDNPLGRTTFDKSKFIYYFVDNSNCSREDMEEKAKHGNLAEDVGSRVHSWRALLGLISFDQDPEDWVSKVRDQRKRFYSISDRFSIK